MIADMQYEQKLMGDTYLCSMWYKPGWFNQGLKDCLPRWLNDKGSQVVPLVNWDLNQGSGPQTLILLPWVFHMPWASLKLGGWLPRVSINRERARWTLYYLLWLHLKSHKASFPLYPIGLDSHKGSPKETWPGSSSWCGITIICKNMWNRKYCCSHFWKTLSTTLP